MPRWGRVLLAGGDSVVSRALLVYLRKEGIDAAIVSDDPAAWPVELGERLDTRSPRVVVLSPTISGTRRESICRWLRSAARTQAVPIIALHDPGDMFGAAGAPAASEDLGGASEPARAGRMTEADISIVWPFRLREVLNAITGLLQARPQRGIA